MTKNISRRKFTKAAAASSVFSLIPGKVLGANEKVNVAFIGCGGQGGGIAHNVYNTKHVNAVALCDVAMGTGHTAGTEKKFNGIPKFKDFRKMFDKMGKEIDAV
ncbi:MAG: oxidoreductase, partial [Verrucomicrobiales bacterium]|nr:oxidoreductase [Verrucomicrobiales bacterium]